jgi:hypothetical protein
VQGGGGWQWRICRWRGQRRCRGLTCTAGKGAGGGGDSGVPDAAVDLRDDAMDTFVEEYCR